MQHENRFTSSFLALHRRGIRLDRRCDERVASRFSAVGIPSRNGARIGRRLHCRSGSPDTRRNRVAARVGGCESLCCRSHWLDRSAVRRRRESSCRDSPRTRSSWAFAISCRTSPTIASCCGRIFVAVSLCSKVTASRYDILIYPRHLPAAAELVARFGRQRFVLDHLAKPDIRRGEVREWEKGIRELAKFPLVYCKLSGLVTEADWMHWTTDDIRPYLDVAFECFGPDRLLAGSDWPVCTLAADYARTIALVDDYMASRPVSERDAVMGGNAARLWHLHAPRHTRGALSVSKGAGELV